MGLLTSQERKFVSIFVKPTIDLTTTLEPAEKGVAMALGKVSYGNPYYGVVFKQATEKLKTININAGGDIYNELAFHMADFFRGYNGKIIVGRLLGANSTTKILEVKKDGDGIIVLDDSTDINIFGDNNIKDYQDTSATELAEVVITSCIAKKFSFEMINKNDYITFQIFDEFGNTIYKVEGGAKFDSVDDYGEPNYIGNKVDNKIAVIKIDTANPDYESNFIITKTYDNGLVTESGDLNYTKALEIASNNIEKCDYAFTGGRIDNTNLVNFRNITYKAKVPLIIDIYADTVSEAIDKKTAIGLDTPDVMYIWNREKDEFQNLGALQIGLSGWYVGQAIKRNMSRLVADVEYRIEGVAGVDYPVPRIKANELPVLSDDDKTLLVDNRINTVAYWNDTLILADALSGNPKNQATRLFPVVEGNYFIERYIARIMEQKLFKNLTEAKLFIKENVRVLFDRCARNNYFNSEAEVPYTFTVTDKDSDTVVVEYKYVPNGIMRRGIIAGTLVKKIN
jgi:hypothetical protein